MKNTLVFIGIVFGIFLLAAIGLLSYRLLTNAQIGSVQTSSEYHSTFSNATTVVARLIKKGSGTFGSVVVTGVGTGNVIFYDATSTIPAERTIAATSSLPVITAISPSQAAGTYTYDITFFDGLIAVYSGTQGTSTITSR